ncbi:uncharacterized protein LOC132553684 [Ylistrum balloti]|uniref:uncharacterized protein LOC132553684 n=1 Tax=Ylistrum balloti TaxID=509963 RepID=UPI0029059DF4|nr:uncharacterized protein LOC132553684 [Ylistrum balloti]
MDNWTSRPQDKWPRLTGLANRDRSSVEEAQMSTYESPYTAENPASFYHYSLHPDDLATRRSISVYSLKDPEKKKNGRFPQCRVCFATMLLVSLGVAIAVAVTLAIMLSNPHPKFYRTKSTGNTTLNKDVLREKEADFGSGICELMNAMFDLQDNPHQSTKITECSVILLNSPGKMEIKIKLNADEAFIKSDADKIKAMLVANAINLSSNSSVKKLVEDVPSNDSHISATASDVITLSTSAPSSGQMTVSTSVGTSSSSEVMSSAEVASPSYSQPVLESDYVPVSHSDISTISRVSSAIVTEDYSTPFASFSTQTITNVTEISSTQRESTPISIGDLASDVSSAILTSADASLSTFKSTSTVDQLSSSMSHQYSQMSSYSAEPVSSLFADTSHSVLNSVILSELESSEPLITPTSTVHQASDIIMTSFPGYTTQLNRHISSSMISSEYGSHKEQMYTQAVSYPDVSYSTSVISNERLTQNIEDSMFTKEISKTSIEPNLESLVATKVQFSSNITPSSEFNSIIGSQLSTSSSILPSSGGSLVLLPLKNISDTLSENILESTRMITDVPLTSQIISSSQFRSVIASQIPVSVSPLSPSGESILPLSASSQQVSSSVVMSSFISSITLQNQTVVPESEFLIAPSESVLPTDESMSTAILGPAVVVNTSHLTSLRSVTSPQNITASVTVTVQASETPRRLMKWLDTTPLLSGAVMDNSSTAVEVPMMNSDINKTSDKPSIETVPELRTNYTFETSKSHDKARELDNGKDSVNGTRKKVSVPLLQPEVRVPVVSTTQSPTTTVQDIGRAIFESDISNMAMGTANPKDFWDNILKMVQYTSTKKPKFQIPEIATRQNVSSDSYTMSALKEGVSSSFDPVTSSSLPLNGIMDVNSETVSTSSIFNATDSPVYESNDEKLSVNSLKPSGSLYLESVTLSSGVFDSSSFPSLITATPVLTAEPGFMSSVKRGVRTEQIMDTPTTTVESEITTYMMNNNSFLSTDGRTGVVRLADKTENGGMLSNTLIASVISMPSMETATQVITSGTLSNKNDLMQNSMAASSTMQSPDWSISSLSFTPSTSELTPSDDYDFYDLLPVSEGGPSSSVDSTVVLSTSTMTTDGIYPTTSSSQPQITDDIDFYDLMPESAMTSFSEISSSKIESDTIKSDSLITSTTILGASSSVVMVASDTTIIDVSQTVGMEVSDSHQGDINPSKTVSSVPSSHNVAMGSSLSNSRDVDLSLYANVQSSVSMKSGALTLDISPSYTTGTLSTNMYSSSSYEMESSSSDIDGRTTNTFGIHSQATAATPSLATVSHTISRSSSQAPFLGKSSSAVIATSSVSDVSKSTIMEPPPSEPAVFNPGPDFENMLFFGNDFSKMDFTRPNFVPDDKSSLLNTVPMIPRVTTPNVLGTRVRVPDLFQGETNPFQTAPTTPKPDVTTPEVASSNLNTQSTNSLSSGQFLFDLGSIGSSFRGGLGLGNINFN